MDKKDARRAGLSARSALSSETRALYDSRIFRKLEERLRDAESIGIYVSFRDEADTHRIISCWLKEEKTIAVPKVSGNTLLFEKIRSLSELVPGPFGLKEPAAGSEICCRDLEAMVVPAAAFDDGCRRVGYGKGYYDSILADCRQRIGIAYHVQKVERIDTDPWDISLDEFLTD